MNTIHTNRISRIAAIQASYSIIVGEKNLKDLSKILVEIKNNFAVLNDLEEKHTQIDLGFASKLLTYMSEANEGLEQEIKLYISKDWRYERISTIIQVILKTAISESLCFNTIPEVILNEYTTISSGFLEEKEIGFVNSLLQKVLLKEK